jgi:hypothetical protein
MKLMPSGKTGAWLPVSNRGMSGGGQCFMMVMVDGVLMGGDRDGLFDLRSLPAPDEIHGIEVFAGAASIPVRYGGESGTPAVKPGVPQASKSCGLIAVWTR